MAPFILFSHQQGTQAIWTADCKQPTHPVPTGGNGSEDSLLQTDDP